MSYQHVLQQVMAVMAAILFLVGCGSPAITPVVEVPTATITPKPPSVTPTAEPPTVTPIPTLTPTPVPQTATLQNVHLIYDYCDTRGYMLGCEDATIKVSKLPVVTDSGAKVEIPFGDIARVTMQPSERQHPEVEHWRIRFLDATITLRNQKTIHCEIGSYLPLPKSGDKPATDLYNTTNIKDVYISGEMVDTGLTAKMSLFDIQVISIDAPGNSVDSLGIVRISPRENKATK